MHIVSFRDSRLWPPGDEEDLLAVSHSSNRRTRLHIVHILTRFLRSGSEENTVSTCLWQAARGHRVTLLHGGDADPAWDALVRGKVDVIRVPELCHPIRPLQDWTAFRELRARLGRLAPDVVHTHQSKAGILGRLAAPAGALVVHGIHILPFEEVNPVVRYVYLAAEKLAARRTHLFIGVSDTVAKAYMAQKISTADCTAVVRSGMDLDRFRKADCPPDRDALTGMTSSRPRQPAVILMLAAFEARKRHGAFLAALARHRHALPSFRLLLAGSGPEEAMIRDLVARLGLSDVVHFCGHRDDPEALIALADLTVLTSHREGLPRVVIQSLAGRKPVVVTRFAGIDEVITDGRNGYITDPSDLDDTVLRVADLLNNPQNLARLTRGAAATDVSPWTLEKLGAGTTALYQRAFAARARA